MAHDPLSRPAAAVPSAAIPAVEQRAINHTAGTDSPPTKRYRATRPKSKTGCHTCKKRHKKCDEARPFCNTCLTKGYKCDGYDFAPPSKSATIATADVAVSSSYALQPRPPQHLQAGRPVLPRVGPLYSLQPSSLPACAPLELQYLDAFRTLSLPHLSAAFKDDFFDGHVLRAAHHAPAIRHAVVALGALHVGAERGTLMYHVNGAGPGASPHSAFILEQYGKSLAAAVDAARTEGRAASDLILGVCLLCVLFETLRGNYLAAQVHIQSGVSLVVEVLGNLKKSPATSALIPVSTLVPLLARLDLQASDPSDHSGWNRIPSARKLFEPRPVASKFEDLEESKLVLLENEYHFMTELRGAMLENGQDLSLWPSTEIDKMLDLRVRYNEFLNSWSAAQAALVSELRPRLNNVNRRRLQLLSINHAWIRTVVSQFLLLDELSYDEHYDTFQQIVRMAGDLVDEGPATAARFSFTMDLGVSEPLFWVVMKCRDPELRRRANRILEKSPIYQGMFNSQLAAAIGRRTISLEEGFCHGRVTRAADIRREARVQFVRPGYVPELHAFRVKLMNKFGMDHEEVLSYSGIVHVEHE